MVGLRGDDCLVIGGVAAVHSGRDLHVAGCPCVGETQAIVGAG